MKSTFLFLIATLSYQLTAAQQISPGSIYAASNTSSSGGVSVTWVLGNLHGSTNMSVLPVVLISFKGFLTASGNAQLDWRTSQETNNAGFEIQKSTDARTFTPIGWVDGNTTTNEENSYRFTDTDLQTTSYYRLKQMDIDGKFVLSRIVTVIPEKENAEYLLAYPNPTTNGHLNLRIPEKAISLVLTDNAGKIVVQQKAPTSGQTLLFPYAGTFLLKVETANQSKTLKITNIR